MQLQIRKTISLPNKINLARFKKSPELGPKVLFFSGGSALRKTCSDLVKYTHNSIHIITPFDSGGSSAILRKAFNMPAIGDIRNRLLALADKSIQGYPDIYSLFNHRFSGSASNEQLQSELEAMIKGHHKLIRPIPDPMRKIIRQHLDQFNKRKPDDFSLRKASIGNLILTAGYLQNKRNFDVIIYIFSSLVNVRGTVRPVVNKDLSLSVELENGERILCQHLFSGKEARPIDSKIRSMTLSSRDTEYEETSVSIREKMKKLIQQAELICYPMGSFYSSILANLLPQGVGNSIKQNPCPKIMVPNTTDDPETFSMTLEDQIDTLIEYLRRDNPKKISPVDVLNFILLDTDREVYKGSVNTSKYKKMGLKIVRCPLISQTSSPSIDGNLFVSCLLSFA